MKERPILFSSPMVRTILDDRKTQTRRVIKPQPYGMPPGGYRMGDALRNPINGKPMMSPYGHAGDRLYVKEQCWIWGRWTRNGLTKTGRQKWRFRVVGDRRVIFEKPGTTAKRSATEGLDGATGWVYRQARFMPRWASRILLEITNVRMQRAQEISQADVFAEGILNADMQPTESAQQAFSRLWDSINAKRGFGWNTNPWVWVVEFRRVA